MNRGKRRVDTPCYARIERENRRKSTNYLLNLLDRLSRGINHLMVIYSNAEMEGNRSHPTLHHSRGDFPAVSWSFCVGFKDGIMPSRASAIRETWRDVKFSADFLPFLAS